MGRKGPGYTAELTILATGPCTAMVFVWSYLTDRDPALHAGPGGGKRFDHAGGVRPDCDFSVRVAHVVVPAKVLITSGVFIVIALAEPMS
jgi:arsenite transporter